MKPPKRLKILYAKQKGRCIWCGRQTWLKDTIKNMDDRQIAEFLHIPYSKKHLEARTKRRAATIEHLMPKCYGGSNKAANLAMACSYCNSTRDCHGCSIDYDVLGMLPPEKQKWILQTRTLCNKKANKKYSR